MKTFLTNTLQRKAEKHTSWLLLLSDLDIDTGSDVKEFTDEIWQSLNIPPLLKSSLEKNFRTSKHPLETVETPATPAPTAPFSKHPAIPDQSQVIKKTTFKPGITYCRKIWKCTTREIAKKNLRLLCKKRIRYTFLVIIVLIWKIPLGFARNTNIAALTSLQGISLAQTQDKL